MSDGQRIADDPDWAQIAEQALCARSGLDPDLWFPVSPVPDRARHEAGRAIAICMACLVRHQCLRISLKYWDVGQHGIWGGLVAAERAALRARQRPVTVTVWLLFW